MHKQHNTDGLTIIELLVSIAIIGILASVIIPELSDARARGIDAAIKASMSNIRAQADIYGSRNSSAFSFDGFCADTDTVLITDSIEQKNGSANDYCLANSAVWVYASPLVAEPESYLCIDSTGAFDTSSTTLSPSSGDASCADLAII